MSGTGDKIKGVGQEVMGKAKEKIGDATDNERMQSEGLADQAKGRMTQAKGDVKDKADDLAPVARGVGEPGDVLAVDNDLARVRPVERADEVEERALARAGRTGDGDELARVEVEREPVERCDVAEALAEIADVDRGARHVSGRSRGRPS